METDISTFTGFKSPIDVLLIGVSFEDRCTALTEYLKKCSTDSAKSVIIFRNDDIAGSENSNEATACMTAVEKNYQKITSFLDNYEIPYDTILSQHRNIRKKIDAIKNVFEVIRKRCADRTERDVCIAIDSTCFTRIDLIILLDCMSDEFPQAKIRIIYVSPADHSSDWLTKGYSGLDSILGFPGEMDYLKKKALVILSGFEGERPQNFIEEYEPDVIYLGLSEKDPTCEDFGTRNAENQAPFLSMDITIPFHFSARSIEKCFTDLGQTITPLLPDYNVIVAPLCTKLSVVASLLYARKHPEIQLSYCYPREYNWEHYSMGISKIFVEDIDRSML